jgi:hypothetical protein
MRLSRVFRPSARTADPLDPDAVPLRRVLAWALVGAALVVGLVLYVRYARLLEPLVG